MAKGYFTQHSDADVLAVFDEAPDWVHIYSDSDGKVELVVKTFTEMKGALNERNPFFIEILEDGVMLHSEVNAYELLARPA